MNTVGEYKYITGIARSATGRAISKRSGYFSGNKIITKTPTHRMGQRGDVSGVAATYRDRNLSGYTKPGGE